MNKKKEILKKCCEGKGGPLTSLKNGMLNIGNHAIEGAKSAYKSNMAQYKIDSAINKTDPIDNLKAGVKGLMGGTLGAAKGIGENIKSNIDKVKSIVSPRKNALKQAVKKTGVGTRYPDMAPLKTSMPAKFTRSVKSIK
ncbi:MAG: hypothetical protein WC917_03715 [Bacilli bacterium]|jgi:hypothetical protein